MALLTRGLRAGSFSLLMLAPWSAMAQSSPPDVKAPDGTEIIVTARRREEDLQTVPVSVTAVGKSAIEDFRVTRIEDIARVAPSVTLAPTFGRKSVMGITIRSQRDASSAVSNDPSVGYYFSEAVLARPIGAANAFFDLESIQVLKGPQGTLFGRNTTGGAILITPRRPNGEFGLYADLSVGSFDQRRLEAAVNLPASEQIQLRVAGVVARRDGFVNNITTGRREDGEHSESIRGSLLVKPSSTLNLLVTVDHFEANQAGTPYVLTAVNPQSFAARFFPGVLDTLARGRNRSIYVNESEVGARSEASNTGVTSILTAELGSVTLKNILAYRDVANRELIDFDGSPELILVTDERQQASQISEEFQVQAKLFDGRADTIFGAYYFRENGTRTSADSYLGDPPVLTSSRARNESKSLFGQADVHVLTDVRVTAGLRYTWDDRRFSQRLTSSTGICFLLGAGGVPIVNPCLLSNEASFGALTYTLGVDWKASENVFLYAAHRRGYRSGGFDSFAETAEQLTPYRPETVKDIELGIKTSWRVGSVHGRTNLSVFYVDYSDIQRSIPVISPSTGTVGVTILNAAKAKIKGAELEYTVNLTPELELSGYYAASIARYDKFVSAVGDFTNNRFGQAPDHMLRFAARYETQLGSSDKRFSLAADANWRSKTWFTDRNEAGSFQDPYWIANLNIGVSGLAGGPLSVGAYVQNVFDQNYFVSGTALFNSLGTQAKIPGSPRTYGVRAAIRFGRGS